MEVTPDIDLDFMKLKGSLILVLCIDVDSASPEETRFGCMCGSRGGEGTRGPDPPDKSQK